MQPGPPDMQHILRQAQQVQQQLVAAQQELAEAEVTGTSGGGLVTATVTGGGELKALVIDPSVVDSEDTETLADLVVAAVHAANANARQMAERAMGPLASGLDLGGLGLGAPDISGA
ncbi:MAG: YbaB/EbfC family nucleoid-associated protein [Kutzneria sp.]|nr:YbaB/EbfC family nucleoid-associated protein [Kutzneria sp.]